MVSYIVVSYNSANSLRNCLESLLKQKNSEVILVDNNSLDESVQVASSLKGVKVLAQKENLGFNGGNQVGVNSSSGEIIVFLNPDAVAPANLSQEITCLFKEKPEVGVVGCRMKNSDGSLQRTCNTFPTFFSFLYEQSRYKTLFPQSSAYKDYIMENWDRRTSRYVDAVSGACMAIKKTDLEELGGLDVHYFLFFEEFDLCRRVSKAGLRTYFLSDVTVSHIGGESTKRESRINQIYINSRNYYIKKFHGPLFLWSLLVTELIFNFVGGSWILIKRILGKTTHG